MPTKRVGVTDVDSHNKVKENGTYTRTTKVKKTNNEIIQLNVPRSQIRNAIKWSKVAERATWGYLIWTGAFIILGITAIAIGSYTDNFESAMITIDWILAILGLVLVLIWCAKSYKILLESGIKGLYLDGIAAVYWGAVVPIAHLFMPLKYVRDLYKHFNAILGKSYNIMLIGRRWGLWLTRLVSTRIIDTIKTIDLTYRIFWLLTFGSMIASSILFVKIVRKVRRAQKVYLKRTKTL